MSLKGSVRKFVPAYRFDVDVPGFKHSGFASVSEITQGGRWAEVTLSRGVVEDDVDMEYWAAIKDSRDISVRLFDRFGEVVVKRVQIRDAKPVAYQLSRLDANKSEVLIESLVLTYFSGHVSIQAVIAPKT